MTTPTIFLIAGEASGDLLGARLMARLKERTRGAVRFDGIGGPHMQAEGLVSRFPMSELSVMGIAEIAPRIPHLLRRIRETAAAITASNPAIVLTIDAPDFAFRVARRVARNTPHPPLVHYVAPTVWAWRPGRARKIARFLDHLLALFPFEPPYFEREGLACSFVGHPAIEGGAGKGDGDAFRRAHGLRADQKLLLLLPGSRHGEVSRLLPVFVETVRRLAPAHPGLAVAVPVASSVRDAVLLGLADLAVSPIVVDGEPAKFDAFAAADVALAASGTVTLELALSRTPTVVTYKANWLTAALVRAVLKTKFAALPNVVLGRMAMPELIQERCNPTDLSAEVGKLLADPGARTEQRRAAEQVAAAMGFGGASPSARAADIVLTLTANGGRG
ncbi:MAG: lpxB [Rhodospirillales bacterium]|nr:lpxB [Rhodospirillales bacterium]